jgi:hypothetical protein
MTKLRRAFLLLILFATGFTLVAVSFPRAQTGGENTSAMMRRIFRSLATAYIYSLEPAAFEDHKNREEVRSALLALVNASEAIEAHGADLDPSYGYLKASLASGARRALRRLDNYQLPGARYLVTQLPQSCMACHVRVGAIGSFDLGRQFLAETNAESLPAMERVSVEVAVRQFDTALDTYEEILRDRRIAPILLNLGSTFEEYLRLCFSTGNNTERPAAAFRAYLERDDIPANMRALVTGWIETLERLDLEPGPGTEIAAARALISDAKLQERFVSDRKGLVDFVAAETILHRYLMSDPGDPTDVAEVYYLLAVAEANASRSYWISETAFLLEKVIRYAPQSPHAKEAYTFLEQYTVDGYAGSTLPAHVDSKLQELRELAGD